MRTESQNKQQQEQIQRSFTPFRMTTHMGAQGWPGDYVRVSGVVTIVLVAVFDLVQFVVDLILDVLSGGAYVLSNFVCFFL